MNESVYADPISRGFTYQYERPAYTADIVVLCPPENVVLLVKRKNDPFAGRLALPGGFVERSEDSREAAQRELQEETNLWLPKERFTLIGVFDTVARDPRGWVVSAAYGVIVTPEEANQAKAGDDAASLTWRIAGRNHLAFDHEAIVDAALARFGADPVPHGFGRVRDRGCVRVD